MARLNPYLNFNGDCAEAMAFYKNCLGGTLTMQKLSESPMGAQLSSTDGNRIMHSCLSTQELTLMASDMMGAQLKKGNDVGLCLNCNTDEEIELIFNKLSEGGLVQTPLHQTFWGATYGELTDKFGLRWMLNFTRNGS